MFLSRFRQRRIELTNSRCFYEARSSLSSNNCGASTLMKEGEEPAVNPKSLYGVSRGCC